jgi:hypothetical protein
MSETTLEEAGRCWRCKQAGKQVQKLPAAERYQGFVLVFQCETKLCHNYQERWIVQVRPDGSIPDRSNSNRGINTFTALTPTQIRVAEANIRDSELN